MDESKYTTKIRNKFNALVHDSSHVAIGILDDGNQRKIERIKEGLLAMRERSKILKDTIVHQDDELKILGDRCTKFAAKLSSVENNLDPLMGHQRKHTLVF